LDNNTNELVRALISRASPQPDAARHRADIKVAPSFSVLAKPRIRSHKAPCEGVKILRSRADLPEVRHNPAVAARKGYGDETWRLARAGDTAGLRRAADLLLDGDPGALDYDGHRARAFALALEGRVDDALAELNEGWTADWPFPAAYAADTARVRYLAGDYERSLSALQIAVRGAERLDPQVADLVSAVVAHAPKLRLRAVRVALGGGTTWQRLRNAAAVAAAR
jgi:hypothetical protein